MITVIILLTAVNILLFGFLLNITKESKHPIRNAWVVYVICIIIEAAAFGLMCYFSVKPIDVYRGNTELKIIEKCINGKIVESDTIVIWKK